MLETRNVSVFYGRHRALENVSATVSKGEIVVMLGANGAGKSTLIRAIAGQTRKMDGGSVLMDGSDITRRAPHEIVETGIALVPEDRGIFADLTVHENLVLGAHPRRARALESDNLERVLGLFPKLKQRRKQLVRATVGIKYFHRQITAQRDGESGLSRRDATGNAKSWHRPVIWA